MDNDILCAIVSLGGEMSSYGIISWCFALFCFGFFGSQFGFQGYFDVLKMHLESFAYVVAGLPNILLLAYRK